MKSFARVAARVFFLAAVLAGCGQKGDLRLPGEAVALAQHGPRLALGDISHASLR